MLTIKLPGRRVFGDVTIVAEGDHPLQAINSSELDELILLFQAERDRRASAANKGLTDEEAELVGAKDKIGLIKAIRRRTGLGLSDAKAIADRHLPLGSRRL